MSYIDRSNVSHAKGRKDKGRETAGSGRTKDAKQPGEEGQKDAKQPVQKRRRTRNSRVRKDGRTKDAKRSRARKDGRTRNRALPGRTDGRRTQAGAKDVKLRNGDSSAVRSTANASQ